MGIWQGKKVLKDKKRELESSSRKRGLECFAGKKIITGKLQWYEGEGASGFLYRYGDYSAPPNGGGGGGGGWLVMCCGGNTTKMWVWFGFVLWGGGKNKPRGASGGLVHKKITLTLRFSVSKPCSISSLHFLYNFFWGGGGGGFGLGVWGWFFL